MGLQFTQYDPMIGVRTAAMLGGFLFLMILYITYKSKCKRSGDDDAKKEDKPPNWTKDDQEWVDKFNEKIEERIEVLEALNSFSIHSNSTSRR